MTISDIADASEGFGRLVAQTARHWRRALDLRLRPFGLTEATWLPLLYLSRTVTPMRQKDLAAALSLDDSSVVRLLDALQTAGMVERRDDPTDRRVKTIHLTDPAFKTIEQVEAVSATVRAEILSGITEDHLAIAADVLQTIHDRLAEAGKDNDD